MTTSAAKAAVSRNDKSRRGGAWAIWRIPVALALLTMAGLLVALLAPAGVRWISWIALAIPVLVALACARPAWRRKGRQA
ncbi:hypothetical protein ACKI2N_022390 [Cupriavidus sp. 30B13]|uniref:hypothetical protein n=1 Tax=Cupriavidus sp. 30B13 TaxID=3384241 RepID=UPI003B9208CD